MVLYSYAKCGIIFLSSTGGSCIVKLYFDKKSKDPTYFIQMGIRNGTKTTTRNVKRIGKHSELLAITPDPLSYAREQVALYNEEYKNGKIDFQFKINFDEKLLFSEHTASQSTLRNVGYFFLQHIYRDLHLNDFFDSVLADSKATFNCNDINRFLTFGRILDPKSKLGTLGNLSSFYEQPTGIEYQHILRHLDILSQHYDTYMEHLFENSCHILQRNTSVCYFDCTNFYFEKEFEDEEYVDPVTGEILKGLRRYGVSKEHRPNPIVQMGLFMDGNGIPLSMCINPGSANESVCAVPLERKLTKMLHGKKFIYCADAGLGTGFIRKYNSMGGRAYIVTQSVKKLPDKIQDSLFSDIDYRRKSNGKRISLQFMKEFDIHDPLYLDLYNDHIYRVIEINTPVETGLYEEKLCKNGNVRMVKSKGNLKQFIIVTFSRKLMEYQRSIRYTQVERAVRMLNNRPYGEQRKGLNDVRRFIKRTATNAKGEKVMEHYEINLDAIAEEERFDGFYAVATNLNDNPVEILNINSQRYRIEECFRILKTNFGARPVFLSERNHIIGHFMTCFTALLVYRLLETKLDQYGQHFTTEDILETLRNMNVLNVQDSFYAASYTSSQVCTNLNAIFDLGLDKKYYLPKELNRKLKKISG